MINLPAIPPTFTTRQINCISCHHSFAIAEEFIGPNQPGDHGQNGRRQYRLHPNQLVTTRLRYEEDRTSRPIATPAGSAPSNQPDYRQAREFDNNLCCPRCGADNRNWVQIQNNTPVKLFVNYWNGQGQNAAVFALITLLGLGLIAMAAGLVINRIGPTQTGAALPVSIGVFLAGIGLLFLLRFQRQIYRQADDGNLAFFGGCAGLLVGLAAFILVAARQPTAVWERAAPLGVVTSAAGLVPGIWIIRGWARHLDTVRFHGSLPRIAGSPWRRTVVSSGAFLILFAVTIPFLYFYAAPLILDKLFDRVEPVPTLSPRQSIMDMQNKLADIDKSDLPDGVLSLVESIQKGLDAGLAQMPPDEAQLKAIRDTIAQLDQAKAGAPDYLAPTFQAAVDSLKAYEAEFTQKIPVRPDPGFQAPTGIPWSLFLPWAAFVGLAWAVSTGTAAPAVSSYVSRANSQLPPPIFHSIAAMTRIVAWEAKQALEIRGVILDYIQWTAVNRNDLGGINLVGLHRDQPALQIADEAMRGRMPAQIYTLQTNRWAEIVTATIQNATASQAPRVPNTGLGRQFFADVDRRAYENLRP